MSESIQKTTSKFTANEMGTRDGETSIAVGMFLFALGVPVFIATFWALDRPSAAIVNALCGAALLLIGGGAITYGLWELRKVKRNS
jgi:hypothetical protein